MAELSLQKLRPLIPNDRCFRRRDVTGAVMRLWITREKKEADVIASDLIMLALEDGAIRNRGVVKNCFTYEFIDASTGSQLLNNVEFNQQ